MTLKIEPSIILCSIVKRMAIATKVPKMYKFILFLAGYKGFWTVWYKSIGKQMHRNRYANYETS